MILWISYSYLEIWQKGHYFTFSLISPISLFTTIQFYTCWRMNRNEEEDVFFEILEASQMVTIQSVTKENKGLKDIIATAHAENQKLRLEVINAKEDKAKVDMDLLRHKAELGEAISKLKQFSILTIKFAKDKINFQDILARKQGKINDLQSKCQSLAEGLHRQIEKQKQTSAGTYKLLLDEHQKVKSLLAKQAEEKLKCQQHCKELKEKVNARIRDCNHLYEQMKSMNVKIEEKRKQDSQNKQQIKQYQSKLKQMSGEKIELQLKIISLNAELQLLRAEENRKKEEKQRWDSKQE